MVNLMDNVKVVGERFPHKYVGASLCPAADGFLRVTRITFVVGGAVGANVTVRIIVEVAWIGVVKNVPVSPKLPVVGIVLDFCSWIRTMSALVITLVKLVSSAPRLDLATAEVGMLE